jgi:CheY-like chemotaxis protein
LLYTHAKAMHRILVVDDDETIRIVVAMCLEDAGWLVTTASDGADALTKMQALTHDLVLLDLMMPVLDGWSVLAQRQTDASLSAIPVVVMSAGGTGAWDRARLLGADGWVSKPFDLDGILATLHDVAAGWRLAESGA